MGQDLKMGNKKSKPSTNQTKCRLCNKKAIRLMGLCMEHSLEWADKRADESHELEYPPTNQTQEGKERKRCV